MTALKDNSDAPRKPGRPRGKKKTASREQLMDIALHLFSQMGIARTSLNAIAREAGVTPAMLHYYFNSREQLLDAVIEERFLPLRSAISAEFAAHTDSPVTALTMMVKALAEQAAQHTWFAPLWMQEAIGEMPVLRQHMHARFGDDRYQQTLETVRHWQREGKINPTLAPELLFTTLLSLVLVPFSRMRNDPRLANLTHDDIVRHALAMMSSGLNA
ncbi:MAG: TetR/AcrR family transcriptional regulator [Yokenella regensburgei]|jgi:AcrR family transcriptional regulator|uniref:Solvent efflux pump srpABC operon corepressor n=1 Tax=Yokenella regensburgei TaxID=158877 RepID=A0AB38FYQ9_9ENTR|nr:TetR/AcrR family transcriptional regulator [Yokenella regensburgei]EHM50115.1 transcriptional regulator, TetR family [Yokenella regensburgei ATCC 43003]KAF1367693.1 AcrR family transcriptional regulator [Yokenella regensburgei]KFD24469.1 TetR family transcriptional regulator [Yokenella regensburgei ATCC 49455]MDQ4429844.1 TetR/AcrR family transcriptional regulator [Yokenella regensburgei]MDR2217737.1 TetR/AcrR family transcriptional regulator [Yokenella regensburgei]